MKKKSWAIVGGGMMGMYLALKLSEKGESVTLFESAPEPGGLAVAWKIGDITWDKFYHVILLSDLKLRSLLSKLKLDNELNWVETKTGFYTDGKLYSMSNSIEFLKFPPLSLADKFRLGFTIFYASKIKNWKKLEGVLVEDWLRKVSGKNNFEKIWLPLLRAKLGENYKKTSAAFIWATIQRLYAARRTGLKKEMFGYVNGGYANILKKFYDYLLNQNVKIKTSHTANKITKNETGEFLIEFANGNTESFDKMILTLPSPHISKITNQIGEEEKTRLRSTKYLGVVCASVLIKKPISEFYVTNITDDDNPFTGIIEMSALVDKKYFKGNSLIYLPKYLSPDDPFFEKDDKEVEEIFLSALLRMYPYIKKEDIISFNLARAKNVFALSTINYSDNVPDVITSVEGLYISNSSQIINGTLNVNETLQVAEKSFIKIMADFESDSIKEKEFEGTFS